MTIKLEVSKADLVFEAGFPKPEFGLFREGTRLLDQLYTRLEPHGLKLTDIRMERGNGSVGDQHLQLYLFNYLMTVRVRVERVEITCSDLPQDLVDRFKAAIVDTLRAVKDYQRDLSFRAFVIAFGLHAKLEGMSARDFLVRFVTNTPGNLGASTGFGAAFYFGPHENRLLSTITVDASALVPDGLFVRINTVWDPDRVAIDSLADVADSYTRQVLESLGLQLPA